MRKRKSAGGSFSEFWCDVQTQASCTEVNSRDENYFISRISSLVLNKACDKPLCECERVPSAAPNKIDCFDKTVSLIFIP